MTSELLIAVGVICVILWLLSWLPVKGLEYSAPPCKHCGGDHPSFPPPLSMGNYARTYARDFGWKDCWGPIPPEYQDDD